MLTVGFVLSVLSLLFVVVFTVAIILVCLGHCREGQRPGSQTATRPQQQIFIVQHPFVFQGQGQTSYPNQDRIISQAQANAAYPLHTCVWPPSTTLSAQQIQSQVHHEFHRGQGQCLQVEELLPQGQTALQIPNLHTHQQPVHPPDYDSIQPACAFQPAAGKERGDRLY